MNLYLKVNLPEGKRIRLRDKWTDKIVYKDTFILFPNKPCDILDKKAKRLLEQDPHLVSKTPFETAESAEKKNDIPSNKGDSGSSEDEKMLDVVKELAEIDFSSLKSMQIIDYGKKLGIDIPMTVKKRVKEQMLESRCRELA